MDEFETSQMIEFRLREAGYMEERSLFSREAVRKIYDYTKGYPRKISLVCHQAMEHLVMEDYESVSAELIDKIIAQEEFWI